MAPHTPIGISDLYYPGLQILLSLSLVAVLLPVPSHFKRGNTGVIILTCWLFTSQLIYLVNSIVWKGNIRDPAPFWCDLSTTILGITATAVACSLLCINLQLYNCTKINMVNSNGPSEVLDFTSLPFKIH
jgi:pheromone a factor receptor